MPLFLLKVLLALACGEESGRLPWQPAPPLVSLMEIAEEPAPWLGREVRFLSHVRGPVQAWEGFTTRFQPSSHVGLELWADELLLWDAEAHAQPTATVYVPLERHASGVTRWLEPYDRVLVTGTVHAELRGRPWIEVKRVLRTRESISEGSLVHALRALDLVGRGAWELAQGEGARVLAAPLPPSAREPMERFVQVIGRLRARLEEGWRPSEAESVRMRRTLKDLLLGRDQRGRSAGSPRRSWGTPPTRGPQNQ